MCSLLAELQLGVHYVLSRTSARDQSKYGSSPSRTEKNEYILVYKVV